MLQSVRQSRGMVCTSEWHPLPRPALDADTPRGDKTDARSKNDAVWEVLQPALQLATRFVPACHRIFEAMLCVESRRRVDPSRIPDNGITENKGNWIYFTTNYDRSPGSASRNPEQLGAPHMAVLDFYGFSLYETVQKFLTDRLRLQLYSSAEAWKKGENLTIKDVVWGTTSSSGAEDPGAAGITIFLGAEMIWPLLMPEFTPKEKASCTMMIVATLLHEVAVSTSISMQGAYGVVPQANVIVSSIHSSAPSNSFST